MSVDREQVSRWVQAYEAAWRTAGTEPLAELFTDDATYRMSPYADAVEGLPAIARLWEAEREGPDERFALRHEVVAVEGDAAVVRLEVRYEAPRNDFRDLWVLRFAPDGRCSAFEEWPFAPGESVAISPPARR